MKYKYNHKKDGKIILDTNEMSLYQYDQYKKEELEEPEELGIGALCNEEFLKQMEELVNLKNKENL